MNNKKIIAIISFFIFCCLFIFVYKNSLNSPWERDEGEYAYSAMLLDNDKLPYKDSFLQKPPMIIYTYWIAEKINSDALWPPRFLATIFTFLTIVLSWMIARKEYGKTAGTITAWILIPMFTLPHLASFAANVERFMLLPLVGVLALYVYQRGKSNKWSFFLAGFLSSVAFLYKPIVAFVVLFIMCAWFIENYLSAKNIKKTFCSFSLFITGFISASVIFLGYFIAKGGGAYLWESAFVFNKFYAAQMWKYVPGSFFKYISILFTNWWILFLYSLPIFFIRPKRWWLYGGIILVCLFSVFSSPIGHYYLMLMPFLAIFVSSVIVQTYKNVTTKEHDPSLLFSAILIFVTIVIMFAGVGNGFSFSPKEQSIWIYGPGNPFVESPLISEKIKEITSDKDKIFVAGSESQIYYYSKRLSMSRFNITYPLIIDTPVREKYQEEAIMDFEKELPKVIVYSNREESGLFNDESPRKFINYLDDLISKKYSIVGGYFWEDSFNVYWENLSEGSEKIKQASLLLYSLKSQQTTAKFGGVSLRIEYATSTSKMEKGLGLRTNIPNDYGMLFAFSKQDRYGFWMKDMLVPIDMFWLNDKGQVVSMALDIATSTYPNVFYPTEPARYVLETAAGFARKNNIATGTQLMLKNFPIVSE